MENEVVVLVMGKAHSGRLNVAHSIKNLLEMASVDCRLVLDDPSFEPEMKFPEKDITVHIKTMRLPRKI